MIYRPDTQAEIPSHPCEGDVAVAPTDNGGYSVCVAQLRMVWVQQAFAADRDIANLAADALHARKAREMHDMEQRQDDWPDPADLS